MKTDHNNEDFDKHTKRIFRLQTIGSAVAHIAFMPRQTYLPTKGTLGLVGEEDSEREAYQKDGASCEQL